MVLIKYLIIDRLMAKRYRRKFMGMLRDYDSIACSEIPRSHAGKLAIRSISQTGIIRACLGVPDDPYNYPRYIPVPAVAAYNNSPR